MKYAEIYFINRNYTVIHFINYKLYTIMGTLANVMSDTTKNLVCDKHHNANYVL